MSMASSPTRRTAAETSESSMCVVEQTPEFLKGVGGDDGGEWLGLVGVDLTLQIEGAYSRFRA
jgi:hypothetical protein